MHAAFQIVAGGAQVAQLLRLHHLIALGGCIHLGLLRRDVLRVQLGDAGPGGLGGAAGRLELALAGLGPALGRLRLGADIGLQAVAAARIASAAATPTPLFSRT